MRKLWLLTCVVALAGCVAGSSHEARNRILVCLGFCALQGVQVQTAPPPSVTVEVPAGAKGAPAPQVTIEAEGGTVEVPKEAEVEVDTKEGDTK